MSFYPDTDLLDNDVRQHCDHQGVPLTARATIRRVARQRRHVCNLVNLLAHELMHLQAYARIKSDRWANEVVVEGHEARGAVERIERVIGEVLGIVEEHLWYGAPWPPEVGGFASRGPTWGAPSRAPATAGLDPGHGERTVKPVETT
jgi:hypothetical protein